MITISRKEVGNWILLDYISQKQILQDKISFLEKKYNSNYLSFEEKINSSSEDNFEMWDDSIEWEAYETFLSDTLKKIEEIRNGHFQMA